MTDEAMSHMTIRKLRRKTQQDYVQIIKKLAAFLGRSPDTATRVPWHVAEVPTD
jgi:hypothetical protein